MTPAPKLHQRKDFDQFLLSLETKNILGVTCAGKSDGAGAQALAVISTQLFCSLTGIDYFHTPFNVVMFSDGKPDWSARWENFFNLGHGEKPVPKDAVVLTPDEYLEAGEPEGVIIQLLNCHIFVQADGTADMYEDIREDLRHKYLAGSPKTAPDTTDCIAVHVRRGDVGADGRYKDRFVSEEKILQQIAEAQKAVDTPLPVHVFSQGDKSQFSLLADIEGVVFHLDEDIFETFHAMASAKALIATRSALSYTAGLYNSGVVLSDSWFHKPLTAWRFKYHQLELETTSRVASDTAGVLEQLRAAPAEVAASDLLQWNLAQVLLRTHDPEAMAMLEKVALGGSIYARAASKTLCNSLKMKAKDDPDRWREAQDRHEQMFGT